MSVARVLAGSVTLAVLACRAVGPEVDRPSESAAPTAPRMLSSSPALLSRFVDEAELRAYVDRVHELAAVERAHLERSHKAESAGDDWDGTTEVVVVGSAMLPDDLLSAPTSAVAFDAIAAYAPNLEVSDVASITNNQERGVDEGDIVKRIDRFLIVLRRGRLHSIEIGTRAGEPLRLIDVQDVFPYSLAHEAWYDEVLVEGDRVVVLGYSYETEATEISVFELDRHGRIHHHASHAIRSNDYYSRENYGSRLVDGKLVIYSPIDLSGFRGERPGPWPVYSTWGRGGLESRWSPLVEEIEIVAPIQAGFPTTLHTVIECRIDVATLDCRARGVVGTWDTVHYVSPSSFYLWARGGRALFDPMAMSPTEYELQLMQDASGISIGRWSFDTDVAMVYRIPFDESPVGVVEVVGAPYDQFSFRQAGGVLDLFLVRQQDREPERVTASWLRIPLTAFGHPFGEPNEIQSTRLPGLSDDWRCREQRFVADHLLYADCSTDAAGRTLRGVHVVDLESGGAAEFIETPGDVARIEPVSDDALIIGDDGSGDPERGGTQLTPILLASSVRKMATLFLPGLVEIENRSHAFNWTPRDPGILMGLPFASVDPTWARAAAASPYGEPPEPPSLIAYFTMAESGELAAVGRLAERRAIAPPPDDCETSCFDWYGSVRPIFLEDRILGLIGDELVEARLSRRGIRELQRVRIRLRSPSNRLELDD